MHLKQLKLAGFKSFVDPTVIAFPSQLVAVVGPNGCGKSNVIDAVRWVLGESSAKNLRGESMIDVIFNGSSNRRAVGQASVELCFDNSLGRITGQYGAYQEIVIKRVVTRDGDSSYYLNGTRCRKRDITDIFLGTGASARSYSIIGQGTISKIVEAKPEELRVFLEEAAGISKYKERRKETLQRIAHTRENLLRVADIRDELDKQLQRLDRQAKQAERYQQLVAEEKQCQADIAALKWQELTNEQQQMRQYIAEQTLSYEKQQALASEAYRQAIEIKILAQEKNQHYQILQNEFYQLGAEIVRLEEAQSQTKREQERLLQNQNELQQELIDLRRLSETDLQNLKHTQESIAQVQQELAREKNQLVEVSKVHQSLYHQESNWRQKIERSTETIHQATQEQQVANVHLQHWRDQLLNLQLRLEKLRQENSGEERSLLEKKITELKVKCETEELENRRIESMITTAREGFSYNKSTLNRLEKEIREVRQVVHQLCIEEATLFAQIKNGKKETENNRESNHPLLIDNIQVAQPWQYACELILGAHLQGFLLQNLEEIWPQIKEDSSITGAFFTAKKRDASPSNPPRLIDYIQGAIPTLPIDLSKIIAAENLEEGLQLLATITEEESIITPRGHWFNRQWLHIPQITTHEGILAKKTRLESLQKQLEEVKERLASAEKEQESLLLQNQELSTTLDNLQESKRLSENRLRQLESEMKQAQHQLHFLVQQQIEFDEEIKESWLKMETISTQIDENEKKLAAIEKQLHCYLEEKKELDQERLTWVDELNEAKATKELVQQQIHHYELQYEREQLLIKQLEESQRRTAERVQTIDERLENIAMELMEMETKSIQRLDMLTTKLHNHQFLEKQLQDCRQTLQEYNETQTALENQQRIEETAARKIQEQLQQKQLDLQAVLIRAEDLKTHLLHHGKEPESLLPFLGGLSWQEKEQILQDIVQRISRLGAINLAAIEEFHNENQRKTYLDEQFEDLNEALATLEVAIEKMDKETTQRLQIAFSEVNNGFQSLFPRLFGGGCAKLELTCDNLLEAGIIVMAQPPGKRNSTIHLLSGGEKAMTAVALVFAIFQLNPSPFCMLDEVDAPLDDVNVGRFCTLVKEMSQLVQFLFITHNKITMELADHLIGVTMREPGVSRVVAVDVEEALTMAES